MIPFSLCLKSYFPFLRLFFECQKIATFSFSFFLSFYFFLSLPQNRTFSPAHFTVTFEFSQEEKKVHSHSSRVTHFFWVQMINKMKENFWNTRPKKCEKILQKVREKVFFFLSLFLSNLLSNWRSQRERERKGIGRKVKKYYKGTLKVCSISHITLFLSADSLPFNFLLSLSLFLYFYSYFSLSIPIPIFLSLSLSSYFIRLSISPCWFLRTYNQ